MATFHISIKSAKPGAAHEHFEYITRKRFVCPAKKQELVWWESRNLPIWASGPDEFFDASDKYERANGAAYRELEISLPKELSLEKNIALTRKIAETVLGQRPCVLAIHEKPGSISGERHPHAHAMYSDRACDGIERVKETHFSRYNAALPEKGGARKLSGGKTPAEVFDHARETRRLIATAINDALQEHGVAERVDHRTLKERGIARWPEKRLGVKGVKTLSPEDREAILKARATSKK